MQWLLEKVRPMMPTAQVTDFRFVSIDKEKVDLSITITISNRSFIPIPLADVNYFFESQNKRPVYGSLTGLKTLETHNSGLITVPISITHSNIMDFFGSIEPGSVVHYKAGVDVILNLPVIRRFVVPLKKNGDFVMPFVPLIRLREIVTVGEVSNDEVNVKFGFEVENRNEFGVKINGFEIGVLVEGGKNVGFLKIDGRERSC